MIEDHRDQGTSGSLIIRIFDHQDFWQVVLCKKQQAIVYCPYPNPGAKGKGQ